MATSSRSMSWSINVKAADRTHSRCGNVERFRTDFGIVGNVEAERYVAPVLDNDVLGDENWSCLAGSGEADITSDNFPRNVPHRLERRPIHASFLSRNCIFCLLDDLAATAVAQSDLASRLLPLWLALTKAPE